MIKPTIVETLNRKGLHVEWSPKPEGVEWTLNDPWFIRVTDSADGGYWFVGPERKIESDGKRNGPEGVMLTEDNLTEFVRSLKEAGSSDVRLFQLIER